MVEAAADALLRLLSAQNAARVGEAGACAAAARALRCFMGEAAIVEVALGIVRKLAGAAANCGRFPPALAALLVQAMQEHDEGEATLQEQACLAVEALAAGSGQLAAQLRAAGVEAELGLAEGRIFNVRNKSYPGKALAALAAAPEAEPAEASGSDDDYSEAFDDGQPPWISDEEEAEPEPPAGEPELEEGEVDEELSDYEDEEEDDEGWVTDDGEGADAGDDEPEPESGAMPGWGSWGGGAKPAAGGWGSAGKAASPSAGSGGPKVTLNPASLNGFSPAQTSPGGGGWGSGGQARDLSASFSSAAGSTPAGGNAVPSPLSTGTFEVMTAEPDPLRQAPTLMRCAVLSQVKPAASGEEPSLAIRVTNIPPGMSSAELGALFRGFGAPQTEVTPSSGGLVGRVTFTSDAEMQRALGDPPEAEWLDDDWRDLKLESVA